jgi:uncharacterized membrane protein
VTLAATNRSPLSRLRDRGGLALVAALAVGGACALLWGSSAYEVYKAAHVVVAAIWVGGAATLSIFGIVYELRPDEESEATLRKQANWLSRWVLTPSAAASFLTGLLLIDKGGWGWWRSAWMEIALVGWAIALLVPFVLIYPQKRRIARLLKEFGSPNAVVQREVARLVFVTRLQTLLLVLMLVDMTAKPSF